MYIGLGRVIDLMASIIIVTLAWRSTVETKVLGSRLFPIQFCDITAPIYLFN